MKRMGSGRNCTGAIALGIAALCGFASAQEAEKPEGPAWTIDGEVRLRGEYRQNFDLDRSKDDKDQESMSRVRLGVNFAPVKDLSAYVQIQDSRLWGSETSTTSNEKNLDLHQGFLKVDHLFGSGLDSGIQAGRFEMSYADERLIGSFSWNNIGRSFDGARLSTAVGGGGLDLFATKVHESTAKKGDHEDADFQGIYFHRPVEDAMPAVDLYALRLADERVTAGELAGQSGRIDIRTYGGRIAGSWSGFSAKVEGAAQTGSRNGDHHRASAFAAYFEQAFNVGSGSAGIAVGYAGASGDASNDGKSREFENLFPTNHLHYGFMDLLGWRNLRNPWARLFSRPMAGTLVTVDFHRFDLAEKTGAWKDAGGNVLGRDATGLSGKHVGDELDLVVTFPVKAKLKVQVGVARFWPGEFAKKVRGKAPEDWAYLQVGLPF